MFQVTIAGKTYEVSKTPDGDRLIDGLTPRQFIERCMAEGDITPVLDMARLAAATLRGEIPHDDKSLQMHADMIHAERTKAN